MSVRRCFGGMFTLVIVTTAVALADEKVKFGPLDFEFQLAGPGQAIDESNIVLKGQTVKLGKGVLLLTEASSASQYWLGLAVAPAPEELRKKLNLSENQGLVVEQVVPDSPAAKAGLKPRDVLLKAGDRPLAKVQELVQAVQEAKETNLAVEVNRDGKLEKVTVQPAKRSPETRGHRQHAEVLPTAPTEQQRMDRLLIELNKRVAGIEAKQRIESLLGQRRELQGKVREIQERLKSLGNQPDGDEGRKLRGELHVLQDRIEAVNRQLVSLETARQKPECDGREGADAARVRMGQIRDAIRLLRQAGLEEDAQRIQQKLDAMERQQVQPGRAMLYRALPGSLIAAPRQPDPAIVEIRKQVEQLRREIQELREAVGKR
jgi:predicted  nucleic acid-binding Zn-ribbon protein